jgi:hypothetical protein
VYALSQKLPVASPSIVAPVPPDIVDVAVVGKAEPVLQNIFTLLLVGLLTAISA